MSSAVLDHRPVASVVAGTAFGPILLAVGFERFGFSGPVLTAMLVIPAAVTLATAFAGVPDVALQQLVSRRLEAPGT